MSDQRYHPPDAIANHPMIKQAFRTIGALLIATEAKDFEVDFVMGDEAGKEMHQYHVEITEVING